MKFSLNWINRYTKLPMGDIVKLNEIIDRIALQIVDVDERWVNEQDAIIDVDNKIITNRPYAFGHRGLAREIAVMLDQTYTGDQYPVIPEPTTTSPLHIQVTVEDPDLCPRFTALAIKGIKIGPSPDFLKYAVESLGLRSINNLVDITNLIMLDTAQPVHAYDYHKIAHGNIIVRRAKNGEKITTLDGVERTLNKDILLITDPEKAIGLGGVMGAGNPEIDENTTDIILEAAHFQPLNIRQTAKLLKHRTDAVTRFEKGIDPTNIQNVVAFMAELVVQVCGGEIASHFINVNNLDKATAKHEPTEMQFDPKRVDKLLGFGIEEPEIRRILEGFGIGINVIASESNSPFEGGNPASRQDRGMSSTMWTLTIPTYRPDLKEPADVIEDIGRMFGYQNIPNITPRNQVIAPPQNKKVIALRKIRKALTASGLDEVITYPFLSDKDIQVFNQVDSIPVINPLSQEYKYLRQSLVPSLTKVASLNAKYFHSFGIFEISRKFLKKNIQPKPYEEDHGASLQPDEIELLTMMYYSKEEKEKSIFKLKGSIENLINELSPSAISFPESQTPIDEATGDRREANYELQTDGSIKINGNVVGKVGLIDKSILENYDIEYPVAYVEVELQPLIENYQDTVQFKDFSRFQGSRLDYSVLVPMSLPVREVEMAVLSHEWIVSKEVVDVYKELKDVKDKKSISISLYIQKMEGNITADEVYDLGIIIEENLKKIPGLEIRGSGVKKPANYKSSSNLDLQSIKQTKEPAVIHNELMDTRGKDLITSPPLNGAGGMLVEEEIKSEPKLTDKIVVGQIMSVVQHPNADRLVICKVDVRNAKSEDTIHPYYLQIITGADNIKPGTGEGKFIPVALPGAEVLSYKTGERFTIGIGNLRGETSEGMLCSKSELGVKDEQGGIWILDENKYKDKVGEKFIVPEELRDIE